MMDRREMMFGLAGATALAGELPGSPRPLGAKGEFRSVGNWTFGKKAPDATIRDMAGLSDSFYFKYIYDNGRLERMNYEWSRHTSYPSGDPRSLHMFTDSSLILKGRVPPSGGLKLDGIEAGLLRAKLPAHPGMYLELRAKLPHGVGLLPAFWLVPGAEYSPENIVLPPWPPEIDIFEFLQFPSRPHPTVLEGNIEVKDDPAKFGPPHDIFTKFTDRRYEPGTDFSQDFHVFALDWQMDKPIWLVDGEPVKQTYYKWGDAPAQILVSNQIGLNLPGVEMTGLGGPSSDWDFSIKHLRVWKRLS